MGWIHNTDQRVGPKSRITALGFAMTALWVVSTTASAQPSIFRNGFEDGSACAWSTATAGQDRCGAPRFPGIVLVSASGPTEAELSWLPATDDNTASSRLRYQIHAGQDPAFEPTPATLRATVNGTLHGRLSGLLPGSTYEILVVAVDADGETSFERDYRTLKLPAAENLVSGAVVQSMDALGLGSLAAEDTTSLTFRSTAASMLPTPGAILVGQRRDLGFIGDLGYLRRVESVAQTSNRIVVQTTPATLDDVYAQASLDSTIAMFDLLSTTYVQTPPSPGDAPLDILALPLDNGASYRRLTWSRGPLLMTDQIDYAPRGDDGAYLLDVGPIHIEARFDYQPQLRVGASWSAVDGLQRGEVIAGGKLTFDARASMTVASSFRHHQGHYSPLLRRTWLFVQPGPVPIVHRVVFSLPYTVNVFAAGGLQASAVARAEIDGQLGAVYNPTTRSWDEVNAITVETDGGASVGAVASLTLEVVLAPQFSVETYEVLSTRFGIETALGFDTRVAWTSSGLKLCGIDVDVEVECAVSADLSILHRDFEIFPRTSVCGPYVWPAYTLDQPCGPED